jgi:hypothetical protein
LSARCGPAFKGRSTSLRTCQSVPAAPGCGTGRNAGPGFEAVPPELKEWVAQQPYIVGTSSRQLRSADGMHEQLIDNVPALQHGQLEHGHPHPGWGSCSGGAYARGGEDTRSGFGGKGAWEDSYVLEGRAFPENPWVGSVGGSCEGPHDCPQYGGCQGSGFGGGRVGACREGGRGEAGGMAHLRDFRATIAREGFLPAAVHHQGGQGSAFGSHSISDASPRFDGAAAGARSSSIQKMEHEDHDPYQHLLHQVLDQNVTPALESSDHPCRDGQAVGMFEVRGIASIAGAAAHVTGSAVPLGQQPQHSEGWGGKGNHQTRSNSAPMAAAGGTGAKRHRAAEGGCSEGAEGSNQDRGQDCGGYPVKKFCLASPSTMMRHTEVVGLGRSHHAPAAAAPAVPPCAPNSLCAKVYDDFGGMRPHRQWPGAGHGLLGSDASGGKTAGVSSTSEGHAGGTMSYHSGHRSSPRDQDHHQDQQQQHGGQQNERGGSMVSPPAVLLVGPCWGNQHAMQPQLSPQVPSQLQQGRWQGPALQRSPSSGLADGQEHYADSEAAARRLQHHPDPSGCNALPAVALTGPASVSQTKEVRSGSQQQKHQQRQQQKQQLTVGLSRGRSAITDPMPLPQHRFSSDLTPMEAAELLARPPKKLHLMVEQTEALGGPGAGAGAGTAAGTAPGAGAGVEGPAVEAAEVEDKWERCAGGRTRTASAAGSFLEKRSLGKGEVGDSGLMASRLQPGAAAIAAGEGLHSPRQQSTSAGSDLAGGAVAEAAGEGSYGGAECLSAAADAATLKSDWAAAAAAAAASRSVHARVSRFPEAVRQACKQQWEQEGYARVVCNGVVGLLSVVDGRCMVTFDSGKGVEVLRGVADYLRHAGECRIKKWRRHVRMIGEPTCSGKCHSYCKEIIWLLVVESVLWVRCHSQTDCSCNTAYSSLAMRSTEESSSVRS